MGIRIQISSPHLRSHLKFEQELFSYLNNNFAGWQLIKKENTFRSGGPINPHLFIFDLPKGKSMASFYNKLPTSDKEGHPGDLLVLKRCSKRHEGFLKEKERYFHCGQKDCGFQDGIFRIKH